MIARLVRFVWIGQLIAIGVLVSACIGGNTGSTLPLPTLPLPSPGSLSLLSVVQVLPNETVTIKRVVSSETISQNNCGNTNPVEQSIERHLTVTHTADLGGEAKISADGKISGGIPLEVANAEVSVGSEIAAHYEVAYGREDVQIRTLNLVTNGGANQQFTVNHVQNWNTGTITVTVGTWTYSDDYEFYTSAGIEQLSSIDLGCPTPTATVTATVPPVPSETPAVPTEVALIIPTATTPPPPPTETPTPEPERHITVSNYLVQPYDTLGGISLLYTGSVDGAKAIRDANGIGTLRGGQVLSIPVYIVQPGDTIGILSRHFDVLVSAIVEGNNLRDPDLINSGQILVIPVNCQSSEHCN